MIQSGSLHVRLQRPLAIVQSTVRISECAGRRASDAATRQNKPMRATKKQSRSDAIRALGKTVRLRDKDHRRFVLRQACVVCGRVPSDPHHLTFTQPRALGRRVSESSSSPSAESTIGSYIALVTRPHGGGRSASTRFLSRLGSGSRLKVTRSFGKTPAWMRENPIPSRHRKVPLVMELQRRRPRDGRYAPGVRHIPFATADMRWLSHRFDRGAKALPRYETDRWLRADRPSLTKLPSAYRHRKIPAEPSSPPRIKLT